MTCQDCELELDDYVDGVLPPDRRHAVEAHLQTCPSCRVTAADFASIRSMARTLEPQLPSAHVWNRVAAAFEQERMRQPLSELAWWRLAGGAFAWRPIAAAAVMLVLLGGASWLAWRDTRGSNPQVPGSRAAAAATPAGPVVVNADVQLAEHDLTTAISSLEQVTSTQTDSLDPGTAKVVQANLDVLDQAIGQSREALKTQPSSSAAQESLFDALRSKVQLLQDTVALINEMRKGDQEGAARIMSGQNP
jgi:anti-sigma factor RsiW